MVCCDPLNVYGIDQKALQSALFNFQSLLLVILLMICTCTYVRAVAPSLIDRNKEGCVLSLLMHSYQRIHVFHESFLGLFWMSARIGASLFRRLFLFTSPRGRGVAILSVRRCFTHGYHDRRTVITLRCSSMYSYGCNHSVPMNTPLVAQTAFRLLTLPTTKLPNRTHRLHTP